MPAALHPYLRFPGNAREAFEFYGAALGAQPQFATFGDFGAVPADHPAAAAIMHGSLEVTDLIRLYVSDDIEGMSPGPLAVGNNITLAIMGDDEAVIRGAFDRLSDGGSVQIPLGPQPWGDTYGAFTDKFGINWQMNISAQASGA